MCSSVHEGYQNTLSDEYLKQSMKTKHHLLKPLFNPIKPLFNPIKSLKK